MSVLLPIGFSLFRQFSTKYNSVYAQVIIDVTEILHKMSSTTPKYNWSISLICPDGNHDPIELPHQEALFLGRCPATRIVDPRCSRKQVKMFSDLNTGGIQVTQLGSNSSVLDGIEMIKDKVYTMKHTSTLHILAGLYPQKVLVKGLRDTESKQSASKKSSSSVSKQDKKHSSSSKSGDNDDNTKQRKGSSSKETKPSSKRKLIEEGSDNQSAKKAKTSDKRGEVKGESSSKSKSKSTDKPKDVKSSKENGVSESKKKFDRKESDRQSADSDDSQYLNDVAEKLNKLKSSGKKMNTPVKLSKPPSVNNDSDPTKGHDFDSVKASSDNDGSWLSDTGPALSSRWDQYDSLYVFTSKGLVGRSKIAGFDIDGTVIDTQSGKKFPTHPGDWRMKFSSSVVKKIRAHYEDGFKIVFFTNQMGVSKGKTNILDLKSKFADVLEEINVPIQIFVSTKSGLYRKPCTGMWEFLVNKANNGVAVDLSQSFYIGDAAGRQDNWTPKKKKDFSCSDRLFALNIGIDFRTPEEFFIGYPICSNFKLPQFDPRRVSSKTPLLDPPDAKLTSDEKEIIVLTGCPASGKSFFSKQYLVPNGYVYVNRDTLGTWQKCVKACKEGINQGSSVVIDNTNPDVESRARYLQVASSGGVPCRCFVMATTLDQAKHNERYREITDKSHETISEIVMNSFKGKYKPPEKAEGFTEIVKVNFVPKFKDEKHAKLYKMFLMEK